MSRAVSSTQARSTAPSVIALPRGYFERAQLPLHSLVFLLPMIFIFEIGTYYHPADTIAFHLLQLFFHQLGANGRFLPALAVVGILLAWHIARRDVWTIKWTTLATMGLESALVALPLLALNVAIARWHVNLPLHASFGQWRDETILSIGAGIYEELVFRLILMTLLMLLLADVFRFSTGWSNLLMVLISAVLFSLYHYLGAEPFSMQTFAFRTVAGIYFGVLLLTRGFGITAGCHMFYDVSLVGFLCFAGK